MTLQHLQAKLLKKAIANRALKRLVSNSTSGSTSGSRLAKNTFLYQLCVSRKLVCKVWEITPLRFVETLSEKRDSLLLYWLLLWCFFVENKDVCFEHICQDADPGSSYLAIVQRSDLHEQYKTECPVRCFNRARLPYRPHCLIDHRLNRTKNTSYIQVIP